MCRKAGAVRLFFVGYRLKLREFAPCLACHHEVYPRLMFLRAASATGSAALYFVLVPVAAFPERASRRLKGPAMKADIHPNYHTIKVVMTDGTEYTIACSA